ncbi:MAG: protein kinase [Candidatus Brocadiia bacterium]
MDSDAVSVTYKAHQAAMARFVSFKVLKPEAAEDADIVERFYQTAKLSAQIHHPNIASIYDVSSADDRHFCTMEYVEGRSVGELLRARQKVASADAVRVAIDVAQALHHANDKGLPGNRLSAERVVLSSRGEVKILPPTLAPQDGRVLDDGYVLTAVGVLLYAMLTGGRVDDLEVALEPGSAAPSALPPVKSVAIGARQDVASAVDRLIGTDTEDAYTNVDAALADLRELLQSQERVESRTRTAAQRAERRRRHNLLVVGAVAAVALVAAALIIGLLVHQGAVARRVQDRYRDAVEESNESIRQFNEVKGQFDKAPTRELAEAALTHLEAAKAPFAQFHDRHPAHDLGREAQRQVQELDEKTERFRRIAQEDIREAQRNRAAAGAIDRLTEEFEEEKNRLLRKGGTLDEDQWRQSYESLRGQFQDNEYALGRLAVVLDQLHHRVAQAQMEIDTNALMRRFTEVYKPALQFGKALQEWDDYRQKYLDVDVATVRTQALENYRTQSALIRREAREQFTKNMNWASSRAQQKNYAGAREIYRKIAENFGIERYVREARQKLEELPQE